MDPRFQRFAELLVGYSTGVKKGDLVLIQTDITTPHEMNEALIVAVMAAGGELLEPMMTNPRLYAAARVGASERSLRADAAALFARYLAADVNLIFRGYDNPFEMNGVPPEQQQAYGRIVNGLTLQERIDHSRWVLTNWPTSAFAVLNGMSKCQAEDYFFGGVLADYPRMARAVVPLKRLMERTDQVKIVGPGTNLTFSIKGINVVPCVGKRNNPDGECYTAPVKTSMNGTIQYNTPAITREGKRFEGIGFKVRNGKIVDAWCRSGDLKALQAILDTDPGARYFGEFSFGLNHGVTQVVGDTLWDEKAGGTCHLTPGNSYASAPNGNNSAVHWDLVFDQRPGAGGGKVYFDGKLVRKDGLFVLAELQRLNPPQS